MWQSIWQQSLDLVLVTVTCDIGLKSIPFTAQHGRYKITERCAVVLCLATSKAAVLIFGVLHIFWNYGKVQKHYRPFFSPPTSNCYYVRPRTPMTLTLVAEVICPVFHNISVICVAADRSSISNIKQSGFRWACLRCKCLGVRGQIVTILLVKNI